MENINNSRLFNASCLALMVTAMTFALRAGLLNELGIDFGLNDKQLGYMNMMAFLGFPLATLLGGPLYNAIGPKKIMWIAFISHILGIVLTIIAGGYWTLLISTFFIGFANGSVEAACNPMIANMYSENKTTMLNKFHVWFPGGLVIGTLVALGLGKLGIGWQIQISTMIIPTLIYGYLIFGQKFPDDPIGGKINLKELFPIVYLTIIALFVLVAASDLTLSQWLSSDNLGLVKIFLLGIVALLVYYKFGFLYATLAVCMSLTATTELGTQQWVEKILASSGAPPLVILLLVTGVMAIGRYFGGPLIHRFKPIGILLGSAIIATCGLLLMSQVTGPLVYVAAVMFAVGVMYFWPTMIGSAAEYTPETGALGLSFLGGIGMFATGLWQPIIGGWLDTEKAKAMLADISIEEAELIAGQATLDNLAYFPALLIILFGLLYYYMKQRDFKPIS